MKIEYFEEEFDIPDFVIDKFLKDFDGLPGSGNRESVLLLRDTVNEILEIVEYDPEILEDKVYFQDFIKALAMKQAMYELGILYDA